MSASPPAALFMGSNGEIACAEHGGGYLKTALTADPSLSLYLTPLGHWQRVTPADQREATSLGMKDLFRCETCKAPLEGVK